MYLCVYPWMCVCKWGRRSWEKRNERRMKKKRNIRNRKHELIHTDKQTDKRTERQTDRQIDRHKSFIDMRYKTE